LNRTSFDLVITDLRISDASGIDLIKHIKRNTPETEVILMTAYGSIDITIEAIKAGAYYYLEKPYTSDRLFTLLDRAFQLLDLRHENESLKRKIAGDGETFGMIGRDPQMHKIFETIRTAAPSDASVLIEGESGTGKELIATAFHAQSQRAAGPFIRINCAAIPHELIESELFGYTRKAHSPAPTRDKRGLIEAANQGTLTAGRDRGNAHTPANKASARASGDEDYAGSATSTRSMSTSVSFPLRIATLSRFSTKVSCAKISTFAISTIKIKVPPLRERLDDVPVIAGRFLMRFNEQYGKNIRDMSPDAMMRLVRYDWPATSATRSVIERAVLFCAGTELLRIVCPMSSKRAWLTLLLLSLRCCQWKRSSARQSSKLSNAPRATSRKRLRSSVSPDLLFTENSRSSASRSNVLFHRRGEVLKKRGHCDRC
jgi:DNA-binding NtrC family response regulator